MLSKLTDWITANNYDMNQFDITYSLTTPAPLSMRSGLYTGQTTFRVGGSSSRSPCRSRQPESLL